MNITIRQALAQDLPSILEILNFGVRNKMRRGDLAWGMEGFDQGSIEPFIQIGAAYIAESQERQPVGTLLLTRQDTAHWGAQIESAGYIQKFAVATGYSGQNIGGQILERIAEHATDSGAQYLRLVCPSNNPKLREYYEKHGFIRADAKAKPILPDSTHVFYERRLTPDATESRPQKSFISRLFGR